MGLDSVWSSFHEFTTELTLTEEELSSYYQEQESLHSKRMAAFHQLRALFAPLIENIIILDRYSRFCRMIHINIFRLCFLREQASIKNCYIVKLFDSTISPRAFAIVAIKV